MDVAGMAGEPLNRYRVLETAIRDYYQGHSMESLSEMSGFKERSLHRVIEKCLRVHPDGRIWGFRALIRHTRTKGYARKAPVVQGTLDKPAGTAGAFMQLLGRFPDIKDMLVEKFLRTLPKDRAQDPRISYKAIHKNFIDACRAKGLTTEYPFTVSGLGMDGLRKYLRSLITSHYGQYTRARSGDDAARHLRVGGGEQPLQPITRPYECGEFDGHHVDVAFIVDLPSPYGGRMEMALDRFWFLSIRDRFSGDISGYHLVLRPEYNQSDVLMCFKKAVMPWKRRPLTIPALKYGKDGGMPSEVFPECEWAKFEQVLYDNARANIADETKRVIAEVIGTHVNAGPTYFPERRNFVERFHGILEENGFHRLPSTLGNSPTDPRRPDDPKEMAVRFRIKLEDLEELTAVLVSDFNGTPTAHNGYRTPLEQIRYYLGSGDMIIPRVDELGRKKLAFFNIRYIRTVRGSIKHGRRPYIEIDGARYTNQTLATMPELIGQKLAAYVDIEDARLAETFYPNDQEFGVLEACGHWGWTPHTLQMRQAILKAKRRRLIHYLENDDPVMVYQEYLSREAGKSANARKKLLSLDRTIRDAKEKAAGGKETRAPDPSMASPIDKPTPRRINPAVLTQKTWNH